MQKSFDSFAYSLARLRWDVFGTLTFKGSVPSTKRCFGRAWAHMHQAAELSKRPYSELLICLRPELGEEFGRFHFHYLLGGTLLANAITLSHQLEHHWFGLFGQGAIAKCRAYDHTLHGVEYVTKCLSQGTLGKNEYELRKFNLSDAITLSDSCFRVIRSLDQWGQRIAQRNAKKRGGDELLTRCGSIDAEVMLA